MPRCKRWVSEAFEEAFVPQATKLLVHVLVSEGERREVRLEDHLVLRLRLEAHAEQQVVEDLLVGVRRVGLQGLSHEAEVEVRGDGRRIVDWPRGGAAQVPHDAPRALVKAGGAEGEGLGALVQDGLLNFFVRRPVVVADVEELLPQADAELGPEGGRVLHGRDGERTDCGLGAGGTDDERANVGRVRGATAVFDVADDDVDHLVGGRFVARGGSVEDCCPSPTAEAHKRRQIVNKEEVVVHLLVPLRKKLGAGWREEVAEALGLEACRGRRLRRDGLQRDRARGLYAH